MENKLMTKDIPISERPYEKLEAYGASALSDSELLAIVIRTGSRQERATELAMKVINARPSGLLGLHEMSLSELQEVHGIGRVKAIQLKAVSEISKRMSKATYSKVLSIKSPGSVASAYMEEMRHFKREHTKLLLLDTKYQVKNESYLSVGTVNTSLMHPREVFSHALKNEAVSIVLLHNHPSGNPQPSPQDIEITQRITEAGSLIGVPLLDHIIIGDGTYVSLKEKGYIN